MRIGQGIDVHAFSGDANRTLRLGGVEIPEGPGLEGHSDADVVVHAIVDAILGAAVLGDIGAVFGTNAPRWAGADSSAFLLHSMSLVQGKGLVIGNVDCTVVAARPRLRAYVAPMREALAGVLDVDLDAVSVKATTTDGLGFTGRGEGIACLAVALLRAAT